MKRMYDARSSGCIISQDWQLFEFDKFLEKTYKEKKKVKL